MPAGERKMSTAFGRSLQAEADQGPSRASWLCVSIHRPGRQKVRSRKPRPGETSIAHRLPRVSRPSLRVASELKHSKLRQEGTCMETILVLEHDQTAMKLVGAILR